MNEFKISQELVHSQRSIRVAAADGAYGRRKYPRGLFGFHNTDEAKIKRPIVDVMDKYLKEHGLG